MIKNSRRDKSTTWSRRSFIFLLLFSALVLPVYSQNYLVRHYSETDGLGSSTVRDIAQDHFGRMWFATRAGISCFDGLSWKNYTRSHGLPTPSFFKIAVDRRGRIWALSDIVYGILVVYHSGKANAHWSQLPAQKKKDSKLRELTSFNLVEQGDFPVIAVGTAGSGLFLWKDNRWINITEKTGLLSDSVNGIACLNDTFYVATNRGLSIIKINSELSIDNSLNRVISFPSEEIKGITLEEKGKYPDSRLKATRIWVCGLQWIGYFEENNTRFTAFPAEDLAWEKMKNIRMLPDYRSGLYLGQQHRIHYFNSKSHSWEDVGAENGLISAGANTLFIDFEKNIWTGNDRGVSKIISRRFSNLYRSSGLLEDEVTAVVEYEPGKFALGHNSGITFYDGKEFTQVRLPRIAGHKTPVRRVLDMQMDSKQNLWLALAWSGLVKTDKRQRITYYGEKDGLAENVTSLWIDQKDNLYVGTLNGIYYYQPGKSFRLRNPGGFGKISTRRLYGSGNTLQYITSHKSGLYINRADRWRNYQVPGNEKANSVFAVKKESRGRLFVGAFDGLYILEGEKLRKFKDGNFHIDRPVFFILEDNRKRLWFGTDKGVIRWDGKSERQYSVAEGLSGHETNRAAGLVDSSGQVWIGTNRGLSLYNEEFDDLETFKPAPKLQLLYIDVFGKKIPLNKSEGFHLRSRENTIDFYFRGISFIDEKKIHFKHRLVGFDQKWSEEKYYSNQVIRYTSLPAGTYRFLLKARDRIGTWSSVISSQPITIPKPFYKRWWFFLGVSLLVGFLFYGIIRFFSEKQNAALLERKVEERTGQLQKMQQKLIQSQKMEAVGTLAGGIAHDFNNILGIILGNSEIVLEDLPEGSPVRASAETIQAAAERAAGLVRQILTFSSRSSQKRQPLKLAIVVKEAMKLLRSSLPASIEIRQNFRAGRDFVMADHIQLHQVIINLGANAGFAMQEKGGVLEVTIDSVEIDPEAMKKYNRVKPGHYLRLTFSDTGHGMSRSVSERIFEPFFTTKKMGEGSGMGLAVVHGIVKSHDGDITVYSEPGKGTTFHIFLPQIEDSSEPEPPAAEECPMGSERILLVDDEAALAYVEREILSRLGYDVTGKSNAVEALEAFRREPGKFDLLITDLTMPQMTGIQLAEEVRRIKPGIPIIFCSGFSAAITQKQIKGFGSDNFVMKPFSKRDLAKIIRKVLGKKQ